MEDCSSVYLAADLVGSGSFSFHSRSGLSGPCGRIWCALEFLFYSAAVSLLTSAINIHPQYCGILGLCILIGYFGMYLVCVQMGYQLFFKNNNSASSHKDQLIRKGVCAVSVILWLLTLFLNHYVERVSRRTCNMAYVMLVLAVNFEVLAIFMFSEFTPGINFTALEGAFNQNLLASFLLVSFLLCLSFLLAKKDVRIEKINLGIVISLDHDHGMVHHPSSSPDKESSFLRQINNAASLERVFELCE
ncbi:hypothetical protein RDABS01_026525 [Bienertia sinuspersici]